MENQSQDFNPDEMTQAQVDALIDQMRANERGTAYRVMRTKAKIRLDSFGLYLQGQQEAYAKMDVLEGQIVASLILRNLYRKDFKYPLCSSLDGGITGTIHPEVSFEIGIPDGQECASCRWNQFRTSGLWQPVNDKGGDNTGSKGKACGERRALAMLLVGQNEPIVVSLPTKSMIQFDAYANILDKKIVDGRADSYIRHMTRIKVKETTENGNTFGVAMFESIGELPLQQVARAVIDKKRMYVPLLSAQVLVEKDEPMENFSVPAAAGGEAPPPPEDNWEGHLPDEQ